MGLKTAIETFWIEIETYLCMNRNQHDTHTSAYVYYL